MFKSAKRMLPAKRVYFSRTKKDGLTIAAKLGGRVMANIYAGRIVLENKKRVPVAIKLFKTPLTQKQAENYQSAIYDLARAGVKIPKMFMIKLPKGTPLGSGALQRDSWVQVMQLFGSVKQGSKMVGGNDMNFETPQMKKNAIIELTKIANAGYSPLSDILNIIQTKNGPDIIPIDLDFVVMHGKISATERARRLGQSILTISKGPNSTYSLLLEEAIKVSDETLRPLLEDQRI